MDIYKYDSKKEGEALLCFHFFSSKKKKISHLLSKLNGLCYFEENRMSHKQIKIRKGNYIFTFAYSQISYRPITISHHWLTET